MADHNQPVGGDCQSRAGEEPTGEVAKAGRDATFPAERFVRSIKSECLGRFILFGERSLRRAAREYTVHYHRERNHQGLDNALIEPDDWINSVSCGIDCHERLGGMLRYYHRAA